MEERGERKGKRSVWYRIFLRAGSLAPAGLSPEHGVEIGKTDMHRRSQIIPGRRESKAEIVIPNSHCHPNLLKVFTSLFLALLLSP